jgi:hypothetical protein
MWEKERSEQTQRTQPARVPADQLVRWLRLAGLALLAALAVWAFPRRHLVAPLDPRAQAVPVSGLVRGAPSGLPLPAATVVSDRELAVTDEKGFFRLSARRGSRLVIDAPGYQTAQMTVAGEAPVIVLLFPEKPPP